MTSGVLSRLPRQARTILRRRERRLPGAVLILYALTIALLLGLGSVHWALRGTYPLGGVHIGAWTTWPTAGAESADPYARAVMARTGEIPLALGEGLAFLAQTDGTNQPLDTACTYRIGSVTPQARYWTLMAYDPSGRPVRTPLGRAGFTSAEVVRDMKGLFEVVLSRQAQPGNWLQLPTGGRFGLVLRLYDTTVAAGAASIDPKALPLIERISCAS